MTNTEVSLSITEVYFLFECVLGGVVREDIE
jgi:hypothetical protein